jgi:hypothetical protein
MVKLRRWMDIHHSKTSLSTLEHYNNYHFSKGAQQYLINVDQFDRSTLKLLARTNCLPINNVLYRMK